MYIYIYIYIYLFIYLFIFFMFPQFRVWGFVFFLSFGARESLGPLGSQDRRSGSGADRPQ